MACDYIIVGAGSAGCVLAARLSEVAANRTVLLEAGGMDRGLRMAMPLAWRDSYRSPPVNWNYFSEPEPCANGRRVPAHRGKVVGGTSSINGMLYARGQRGDYDSWAEHGLKNWSFAHVLPYFRRAECDWRGAGMFHGGDGPLTISRHIPDEPIHSYLMATAKRLGFPELADFHALDGDEGFGVPDFTIKAGRRASTARSYLHPALGRGNLRLLTSARVRRLLLRGRRVVGVEYERGGVIEALYANREVILAGGAFNSPQILLLSGVGPSSDLHRLGIEPVLNLSNVGRNLQDHHAVNALYALREPVGFESALRLDRMMTSVVRWLLFGKGPAATVPVSAMGFFRTSGKVDRPDAQAVITPVALHARLWLPGWRRGVGHQIASSGVLLRPDSHGVVSLRSPNPLDPPKLEFNLLGAFDDRVRFRSIVRFLRQFFRSEPIGSIISHAIYPSEAVESDAEIDEFVRDNVGTAMHPTGTCAMGIGVEAVLDPECKVRGLDGVRVVDASVMPRVVSGNTNAPVIMIAEKIADRILGRPPLPPIDLGMARTSRR